jgi:hypothetical protein
LVISFNFHALRHPCKPEKLEQANKPRAETSFFLVHFSDQGVDLVLAVTQITTFNKMPKLACAKSSGGGIQFERPQEVGGLLEVGTNGEDFVDQILHANNTVLAKAALDD